MLSANNIDRKSWIEYESNNDFPIQNIPFGVFKTKKNEFHIATIIGKTIKYGVQSEAAYKFERGVDPHCHDEVLRRFIHLILCILVKFFQ